MSILNAYPLIFDVVTHSEICLEIITVHHNAVDKGLTRQTGY